MPTEVTLFLGSCGATATGVVLALGTDFGAAAAIAVTVALLASVVQFALTPDDVRDEGSEWSAASTA
ncbi:hypothetical protein [Mongoliimonas terrestris]|uniref:hypothetical protein n=1 Tax=Mongoliimonas terrestris TaxID=1709001 RepID=UPI000949A8AC|nr:hypothetical protein [Mongoliimonas terrestris]